MLAVEAGQEAGEVERRDRPDRPHGDAAPDQVRQLVHREPLTPLVLGLHDALLLAGAALLGAAVLAYRLTP